MKTSDSFIKSSEVAQIQSPVIKATLQPNWYCDAGVTRNASPLDDAIIFNGHLIYAYHEYIASYWESYITGSVGNVQYVNGVVDDSKFVNTGLTLVAYVRTQGSAFYNAYSSTDGMNWTYFDQKLLDSSPAMPNYRHMPMELTGSSQCLYLAPFTSDYNTDGSGILLSGGGVSNYKTILNTNYIPYNDEWAEYGINITSIGNTLPTVIYYNYHQAPYRLTAYNSSNGVTTLTLNNRGLMHSIKRVKFDGANVIPMADFIPLTNSVSSKDNIPFDEIQFSDIIKGISHYFLSTKIGQFQEVEYQNNNIKLNNSNIYLHQSGDGVNWSSGIYVGSITGTSTYPDLNANTFAGIKPICVDGSTNGLEIIRVIYNDKYTNSDYYGTSCIVNQKTFYFGGTPLDISNSITSYNIQDNDRLTLTLANNG